MRQEGNSNSIYSTFTGGKSRKNDFLRGMTIKIRFMKRLSVEDLDQHFVADGGSKVMFNSCDQVQMKLTQLELSSVHLTSSSNSVGMSFITVTLSKHTSNRVRVLLLAQH